MPSVDLDIDSGVLSSTPEQELLVGAATLLGVESFARRTRLELRARTPTVGVVCEALAALLTIEAQCAQARSEIRSVDPTRPGGVPA